MTDLVQHLQVVRECSGDPPATADGTRVLDRTGRAVLVGRCGDDRDGEFSPAPAARGQRPVAGTRTSLDRERRVSPR